MITCLRIVVSKTYCVVFFAFFHLVHGGVQHILCCIFLFFWLHLVSCVTNVASFFLLSILDCPFGFSYVYLKQMVLVYDIMVM
jgi:hypothetical protein